MALASGDPLCHCNPRGGFEASARPPTDAGTGVRAVYNADWGKLGSDTGFDHVHSCRPAAKAESRQSVEIFPHETSQRTDLKPCI